MIKEVVNYECEHENRECAIMTNKVVFTHGRRTVLKQQNTCSGEVIFDDLFNKPD